MQTDDGGIDRRRAAAADDGWAPPRRAPAAARRRRAHRRNARRRSREPRRRPEPATRQPRITETQEMTIDFQRRRARCILSPRASCSRPSPPRLAAADKPLRVILPVGAGSGVDTIMRAAAPSLDQGARRPAGGDREPARRRRHHRHAGRASRPRRTATTIGVVSNNHVVNPSVFKKMPFDALADITPISVVGAHAVRAGGQPGQGAGEEREGAAGAAQGQARWLQLRVVGQRHHHPPGRRDVHGRGRRRGAAHPVQGRRPDGGRHHRRPGRDGRGRRAGGAGPAQERRSCAPSA